MNPHLFLAPAALALALSGCERRETIRVYTAPKDQPAPAPTAAAPARTEARPPRPQLTWTLPAGWQQTDPGQTNAATFAIQTDAGEATVAITALQSLAGREAVIVNMWREQAGQAPLGEEEAAKALSETEIAGGKGQLFEVAGDNAGKPLRIVTAMKHEGDVSWFYKLAGDGAVVEAQKETFREFLKTVRPVASAAASTEPTREPAPEFRWAVPEGWRSLPAGQMQIAKFAVPEQSGAKAEATVSIFPSDTGGTLANVNRWRGQLGLAAVDEAALAEIVKPLDAAPGAQLAELSQEGRRLLGAIVPRDGRWWFYKLLGDDAAVAAARESFIAFAKSPP